MDLVAYFYKHPTSRSFGDHMGIRILQGGNTNYYFENCNIGSGPFKIAERTVSQWEDPKYNNDRSKVSYFKLGTMDSDNTLSVIRKWLVHQYHLNHCGDYSKQLDPDGIQSSNIKYNATGKFSFKNCQDVVRQFDKKFFDSKNEKIINMYMNAATINGVEVDGGILRLIGNKLDKIAEEGIGIDLVGAVNGATSAIKDLLAPFLSAGNFFSQSNKSDFYLKTE